MPEGAIVVCVHLVGQAVCRKKGATGQVTNIRKILNALPVIQP